MFHNGQIIIDILLFALCPGSHNLLSLFILVEAEIEWGCAEIKHVIELVACEFKSTVINQHFANYMDNENRSQ